MRLIIVDALPLRAAFNVNRYFEQTVAIDIKDGVGIARCEIGDDINKTQRANQMAATQWDVAYKAKPTRAGHATELKQVVAVCKCPCIERLTQPRRDSFALMVALARNVRVAVRTLQTAWAALACSAGGRV